MNFTEPITIKDEMDVLYVAGEVARLYKKFMVCSPVYILASLLLIVLEPRPGKTQRVHRPKLVYQARDVQCSPYHSDRQRVRQCIPGRCWIVCEASVGGVVIGFGGSGVAPSFFFRHQGWY